MEMLHFNETNSVLDGELTEFNALCFVTEPAAETPPRSLVGIREDRNLFSSDIYEERKHVCFL